MRAYRPAYFGAGRDPEPRARGLAGMHAAAREPTSVSGHPDPGPAYSGDRRTAWI